LRGGLVAFSNGQFDVSAGDPSSMTAMTKATQPNAIKKMMKAIAHCQRGRRLDEMISTGFAVVSELHLLWLLG
jgi:hypothetical protein